MTRWFRFYEESINDPKLLRLPDDLYRAWTILLCFASKNGGILPTADDIAVALRMKSAKVVEWITKLVRAGLIDNVNGRYEPHNWNGRQYKSDEAKAPKGKDSYVYIIGHQWGSEALKIGFSKNPWARVVELQTAHHEKLSVLAAFKCKSHSEVDLHDILKAYRKAGEWFTLPTKIYVAIHNASERSDSYEDVVVQLRELLRSTTTETEQIQTTEQIDKIGSAGASNFTEGSKALTSSFWKALGFERPIDVPPEFAGVDWRAVEWERAGWTVDLIASVARKVGPDKPLNYHEKVLATEFAKRQAPLPIVEVKTPDKITVTNGKPKSGIIQAIDDLSRKIAGFDGPERGANELRGAEGEAPPRLLSDGRRQ